MSGKRRSLVGANIYKYLNNFSLFCSTLLFIGCILVTANDLIGNTIDCISANIPGNVLNTYCWIMSTFSVPGKNNFFVTAVTAVAACMNFISLLY